MFSDFAQRKTNPNSEMTKVNAVYTDFEKSFNKCHIID